MTDVTSVVFTHLEKGLEGLCTNVSREYQTTPATFPYVYLHRLSNIPIYDLNHSTAFETYIFEIQVADIGNLKYINAETIFDEINSIMDGLGFTRFYGVNDITTPINGTCNLVARYSKKISNREVKKIRG